MSDVRDPAAIVKKYGADLSDLFGLDRALTKAERDMIAGRKRHKGGRGNTQPNGYAAIPGTGPKGETCGTCKHLCRREFAKTYLKCGLVRDRWTGGRGSDVLSKSPACRRWEPPPTA